MIVLHNAHIIGNSLKHIQPNDRKLKTVKINFDNAIAFPGLINSHDHLDFNLFPQLGSGIYNNYTEWGNDIHKKNKKEIDALMQVPQALRTKWGIYKNLLNGVTTVVNHGGRLMIEEDMISVFQNCISLHSVHFEKFWKYKLNNPFTKKQTFIIHAGEGTDAVAKKEIDKLIKWNLFKRKLIAVHGTAMNSKQAKYFDALIWCPVSNYFLFNKTADIFSLKQEIKILFGTDSALTANQNIWEHLRVARKTKMLTDEELFVSVTAEAFAVWSLSEAAKISKRCMNDMVIAKRKNTTDDFDAFFSLNPEDILLVLHNGEIRLFDKSLYRQLRDSNFVFNNFSRIYVNGSCKYVEGNLPALINQIISYYPAAKFPVSIS